MKCYLYLFFFSLLLSCTQRDDSAVPNEYAARFVRDLNTSDTFRFEFPFRFNQRIKKVDSANFFQWREFLKKTGMKNLEHGVDSVFIRMVYSMALVSEFVMIELNNSGGKWIAEVSKVKSHFNIEKDVVDSFSRLVMQDSPESGWVKLINKLFDLEILSLDDEMIIPRNMAAIVADGDGIDLEIATHNTFRSYGYNNPSLQPEEIWQVKNINSIKDVLWNEFSQLKKWDNQIKMDFYEQGNRHLNKQVQCKKNSVIKVHEIIINDTLK